MHTAKIIGEYEYAKDPIVVRSISIMVFGGNCDITQNSTEHLNYRMVPQRNTGMNGKQFA